MSVLVRSQVLWLGPETSNDLETELQKRDLTIRPCRSPSKGDLNVSCAAVFVYDPEKKGESLGRIRDANVTDMLDYGLTVVVVSPELPDDDTVKNIQFRLPQRTPSGTVHYLFNDLACRIAETIRRWDPGPPANEDLRIDGDEPEPHVARLLRRAFHDCSRITLEKLSGGLTDARVFAVYAEYPQLAAGAYPLPFFAKVDLRERVQQERDAYREYVTNFVPFTQRPNLDRDRCLESFKYGVLVGDFVEHSTSLTAIVHTPARRAVVHSLFDDALRGWRRQAFIEGQPAPSEIPIAEALRIGLKNSQISDDVLHIASQMGSVLPPDQLMARLDSESALPYRIGLIHGDLNTENVRARGTEAILIDFYKTGPGPLVADLASLEVAAAFRLTAKQVISARSPLRYFEAWRLAIQRLYDVRCITDVPPPHQEPTEVAWLWDLCRELRLIGRAIDGSGRHYGYALIAYLLRESSFADNPELRSLQRCISAQAYVCAGKLLTELRSA